MNTSTYYGFIPEGGVLFVASANGDLIMLSPSGAEQMALDFLGLTATDLETLIPTRPGMVAAAGEPASDEAAILRAPEDYITRAMAQSLMDMGYRWRLSSENNEDCGQWLSPDNHTVHAPGPYARATRKLYYGLGLHQPGQV